MLARTLGVPYEEVSYVCAGINHQAWVLSFRHGTEDLYPRLREVMTERHVVGRAAADLRRRRRGPQRGRASPPARTRAATSRSAPR